MYQGLPFAIIWTLSMPVESRKPPTNSVITMAIAVTLWLKIASQPGSFRFSASCFSGSPNLWANLEKNHNPNIWLWAIVKPASLVTLAIGLTMSVVEKAQNIPVNTPAIIIDVVQLNPNQKTINHNTACECDTPVLPVRNIPLAPV